MKVIVGLILFCLLLVCTTYLHKPFIKKSIEQDLLTKTEALIKEAGLDPSGISYDGHYLNMPASLESQLPKDFYKTLEKVHGAYIPPRSSKSKNSLIPPKVAEVSPPSVATPLPEEIKYEDVDFKVERKDGVLIASGLLPTKESQGELLTLLRGNKKGLKVVDQTKVAENPTPEHWWAGKPASFIPRFFQGSSGPAYVHYTPEAFKSAAVFPAASPYENAVSLTEALPENIATEIDFSLNVPTPAVVTPVKSEFFMTESKDGSLVIRGTVDSPTAKEQLLASVKASIPAGAATSVIDNVKVDPSRAPISSLPSVQTLLTSHIKNADQAEMDYTTAGVSLRGILEKDTDKASLLALTTPVLSDSLPLTDALTVTPKEVLDFRAERKDGKILLTGLLPSAAVQQQLLASTKASAQGLPVIDQTRIASRPTPQYWWNGKPEAALKGIFTTSEGPAHLHYKATDFNAKADYPVKADQVQAQSQFSSQVSGVKKALSLTHTPKAAPAPAPVAEVVKEAPVKEEVVNLVKDLDLLPVYFGTDSATIRSKEEVKIQKAATAIKKSLAKDVGLTVGGYADQRGNPEYNKKLSLKRADAVRSKLISLGVNPDRLVVNHFGEDTSNMDKSDLWKARRVSISITPIN